MAHIRPFRAWRHADSLTDRLADLLAPPYDVISPAMREELYARHPKNFVRVDFGKEEAGDDETRNRYTRAARTWAQWKSEGTSIQDARPAFYLYEQEFDLPGRGRRRRRGFFCAVGLEDLGTGSILAHEKTFAGPKADRLRLMHATGCNLSAIFSVYDDPERETDRALAEAVRNRAPIEATLDDQVHRLWVVDDPGVIQRVQAALDDKKIFIADGHHRYETSLIYQAERRQRTGRTGGDQPFDATLMFLANTHDEGLEILPTHRVLPKGVASVVPDEALKKLSEFFEILEIATPPDADQAARELTARLAETGRERIAFVILAPGGPARLATIRADANLDEMIAEPDMAPRVKRLDVTILHRYLLRVWMGEKAAEPGHDDLIYVKDAAEVVRMLRRSEGEAGFLLNPTKMEQVCEIGELGLRMPQKSTYFYPKIITGLIVREMSGGE